MRPWIENEPWPTELFEPYTVIELERLVADAQAEIERRTAAVDLTAACPDCGELAHPAQTTCEGCGSRLIPSNPTASAATSLDGLRAADAEEVTVPMQGDDPRCTCGGNGICTHCDLQSYEPLPLEARGMMIALDMTEAALARPANVVPIRRVS